MKYLHNIEKSAFRRFEYVGYGPAGTYRVRKHGCGGWEAWLGNGHLMGDTQGYLRAATLEKLSILIERQANV